MTKPYFLADGLSVGYDGTPLIHSIRFEVEQGEILTLIGPNGAGKSTILKSIAGQLSLLAGTVYLEGQAFSSLPGAERAKKMASVFTGRLYTDQMTCREVASAGRYPYTGRFGFLSETDRRIVEEALEEVRAESFADRPFSEVSDGQRQRVLLAGALAQEPEIILLDEPTSYLDVRYKLEFMEVLQKLTRTRRVAVILSLHELDLAERVSHRVLCVQGDRILREGTPEEIFRSGFVNRLYGITVGGFDEGSGTVQLVRPEGPVRTFVIAGGGSGKGTFYRLQREGIPFAAGILAENDLDFPAACALASRVVTMPAFETAGERELQEAEEILSHCDRVICCLSKFGTTNRISEQLLQEAEKRGIAVQRTKQA